MLSEQGAQVAPVNKAVDLTCEVGPDGNEGTGLTSVPLQGDRTEIAAAVEVPRCGGGYFPLAVPRQCHLMRQAPIQGHNVGVGHGEQTAGMGHNGVRSGSSDDLRTVAAGMSPRRVAMTRSTLNRSR